MNTPIMFRFDATVLVGGHEAQSLVALGYDPRDPWAVQIQWFTYGWLLARGSLTSGCHKPVLPEAGAIAVFPEQGDPRWVWLSVPDHDGPGQVQMRLQAGQVEAFLAATYHEVPAGGESEQMKWRLEDGPLRLFQTMCAAQL